MSLTDEDKNWILQQLSINAANANAATGQLRSELKASIEHVETALLTEFHKWASPIEQRMRAHREALRALDLETVNIADRVAKLEPPPY
jgi:uncharacterized protein YukE